MRHSPSDRRLSKAVRSLALEYEPVPSTLFLGFHYEPVVAVRGELLNGDDSLVAEVFHEYLCWRAIVHIRATSHHIRTLVLDISGDRVYELSTNRKVGSARWLDPDEFSAILIRQLRRP